MRAGRREGQERAVSQPPAAHNATRVQSATRLIAWRAVTILAGLLPAALALAAPDPPAQVPAARFDVARDITVSLSALGAALFAILGVNAWRRQLKGTTEYQIALRALKEVYAVRESVLEARGRVT